MVSYEVSIGFVIITVLLCAGSLNLNDIVNAQDTKYGMFGWYWLPLFPMFIIFFISALAETNRPPFDLVEAESELVAGFMVEYSSTPYMMFMLGEYVAIVTMCALTTILFLGGWLSPIPYAPFTAVRMRLEGVGQSQVIRFETNVDDEVTVDDAHPLRFAVEAGTDGLKPYVLVRAGLEALVSRALFYDLAAAGTVVDEWFGVWSSGQFFPMQKAAEIGLAS